MVHRSLARYSLQSKVAMGNPFWFRGLQEPTKIGPKLIPGVTRFTLSS